MCSSDLLVNGTLRFGPMPPLDGQWSALGRIVLVSRLVEPGDVFWRVPGLPGQTACSPQHALFRGASGVVAPKACVQPWPGRFCLEVESPLAALAALVDWLEEAASESNLAELKDLQLCRYRALDKTPPTCGRPGREHDRSPCRGRAA